jgi:hypothetical protein
MTNPKHIEPGQRFDRLLVIGSTFNQDHGVTLWHCQCDCGNTVDMLNFIPPVNNRFERKVISCGCQPWISDFETRTERNQRLRKLKSED